MRPIYADIFHGAPETQPLLLFMYACIFPNYVRTYVMRLLTFTMMLMAMLMMTMMTMTMP